MLRVRGAFAMGVTTAYSTLQKRRKVRQTLHTTRGLGLSAGETRKSASASAAFRCSADTAENCSAEEAKRSEAKQSCAKLCKHGITWHLQGVVDGHGDMALSEGFTIVLRLCCPPNQ